MDGVGEIMCPCVMSFHDVRLVYTKHPLTRRADFEKIPRLMGEFLVRGKSSFAVAVC